MKKLNYLVALPFLIFFLFGSCFHLIAQIYDYRTTFSKLEDLNVKYEELSFRSNVLLSEVEYFRNQITIREVATNKLAMRSPTRKEQIHINFKEIAK